MNSLAKIWARYIRANIYTFDQVPEVLKPLVKEELSKYGG